VVTRRATVLTAVALLSLCLGIAASACSGDDDGATPAPAEQRTPTPDATRTPRTIAPAPPPLSGPPARDLVDLARRYRGLAADHPRTARDEPYQYAVGDIETFTIYDLALPGLAEVETELKAITPHGYFFVDTDLPVSDANLEEITSDFEELVYPALHAKFGSEWSPGVDADRRISIVHASLSGAGGYFSGSDEYPRAVVPRSNEREAVYLDAFSLDYPGIPYNSLLAHELQHLVHWHADEEEDSWVNEGLSQIAAQEVGGGSDWLDIFLENPDTQLNTWPAIEDSALHYAASELFFSYLLDRFTEDRDARELVAEPGDSIAGVDAWLSQFGTTFMQTFADWVVANYLDAASGPYAHPNDSIEVDDVNEIDEPADDRGTVSQFGADYLEIDLDGAGTFTFDGSDTVTTGVPENDGEYWWSDRGDGIDSKLTREIDLSDVEAATLRFRAWYDIEEGWDYAYVSVSTDDGATWTALPGTSTTTDDPVGAAYGPGYSGVSGGWVDEEVDLGAYAGQEILLRFEMVTDDATNQTGFAIDDIEIPEIGFTDDASGGASWEEEGFRRMQPESAQLFIVQAIDVESGEVALLELDGANNGRLAFDAPVTIVISGSSLDTAEKATYNWTVESLES
jgi:hypothetical protein